MSFLGRLFLFQKEKPLGGIGWRITYLREDVKADTLKELWDGMLERRSEREVKEGWWKTDQMVEGSREEIGLKDCRQTASKD